MKIYRNCAVLIALFVLSGPLAVSAVSLKLYVAGSLKAARGDVVASYEKTSAKKLPPYSAQRPLEKGYRRG